MTTPRLGGTSSPTASLGNSSSSSGASTRSSSGSNASSHNHNSIGSSGGKNVGPAAAANVFDEAAVSERVWARAIHAVTEQKLSLRSVARLYGLHYMALHRRVRARQAAQSLSLHRQAGLNVDVAAANGPTRAPNGYNGLMANTERFEPPSRLPERPMTLESIRMTDDQNDEAMTMLYEEYGPSIVRHRRDGAPDNSYCYDDDDIREVVRYVVARDSRREMPPQFPSQRWLSVFKRENGLVDGISPFQEDNFHQQFQYATSIGGNDRDYAMAQSGNWTRASPHPGRSTPSPMRSRQTSQEFGNDNYSTSESESNDSSPRQNAAQSTSDQKQQKKQAKNSSEPKHYRQSNTVPAEVWDRAMEDVLIHGMSLRSAAKAHGVHFAALHRRLKKRSLQKDTMPYDPRYIPFEDEAGLIRVINARADLGVLMSYKEVIDLLQRATLNHRSELSEEDVVELVRKFRSRVEGSIRHLVKDWPLPSVNALYQQLGPVPVSAAATTTTSMTSSSMAMTVSTSAPSSVTSSVSPRVVLPPASSLRVNGAIPTIPSIISPRGGYGSGTSSNGIAAGNGELVNGVSPRVGSSSQHASPPRILRL